MMLGLVVLSPQHEAVLSEIPLQRALTYDECFRFNMVFKVLVEKEYPVKWICLN
jgi:hypothetical protein